MADIYVGRQPIYNKELGVYAYELLFRSGEVNAADQNVSASDATSQTILNSFLEIGLEKIVGKQHACFNLTDQFLLDEDALPFSPDKVILEISQGTSMTPELLKGIIRLSKQGFLIALDDIFYSARLKPLARLADMVKVDIQKLDAQALNERVKQMKKFKCKLMAVKIETMAQFEECLHAGFDYFQGYFLSRPRILKGKALSVNRLSILNLLALLQSTDSELEEIEQAISSDVSLSYKILKLINSAFFSLPQQIESIRQAIVLLGRKKLASWASMIALSKMDDRPSEMVHMAMTRARMCELLAEGAGIKQTESYFAAGMFSALDMLMEQPLESLLSQLPLSEEINQALKQNKGQIGQAVQCAKAAEIDQPSSLQFAALPLPEINRIYLQAIEWTNEAYGVLT